MKKTLSKLLLTLLVATSLSTKAQDVEPIYNTEVLSRMSDYYLQGIEEKLYLQLDKPYYSSGERIWFKGYLRNAITHAPLPISQYIYVELIDKSSERISRVKVKRDSTGFNGYMMLDAEMKAGDYTLRGYSRWMLNKGGNFLFSKSLKIISPIPASATAEKIDSTRRERREAREIAIEQQTKAAAKLDYTVQFFPEGGSLLAGGTQVIAFKALAEDGLSIEVKGSIYNANGELNTDFESTHKGMGIVAMQIREGEQYYAVVTSAEGLERRFDLPMVDTVGAAIMARQSGERLLFQPKASPASLLDGAHAIIHSHGRIVAINPVRTSTNSINMEQLFDGINVISLVNTAGDVIAERLFFKRPTATPSIAIKSNRKNYGKRQRATIKLNVLNSAGKAQAGEFGVSVTDNSSVEFNAQDDNIISYLLLSSDLKGYIESPAAYFAGDLREADRKLDLLLRTQGWRRFDLSKILKSEHVRPQYDYERYGEISGSVKGFFGNAARKPKLDVMCTKINYFDSFVLDQSSTFKLIELDMPDSANYVIQSRGRNGGNALTLDIDPEPIPTPLATVAPRAKQAYIPEAFINQSQEKFYYEGGMDLINIDAVYVTASSQKEEAAAFATHTTSSEELEMLSGLPLTAVIQRYPSMDIAEDGVYYRGSNSPARFLIDGIYMEYEDITFMTASEIASISFYSGADAMMYTDAAGGIFVIEMGQGKSAFANAATPPNFARVDHLGYQKAATFYQPSYDTPAKINNLPPDYRTTIFWDGALTPDANGNIEFEFYTADKATSYTITVEGVDDSGEIYRAVSTVERTASY